MNNMARISIITVCYNSVKTLEDTLVSVTQQDYPAIEYIIIDGGSTDSTLKLIEKYGTKIHRCISEPDHGIYDAMNKGIRVATGEVIAFLNADDVYAADNVVSKLMSIMKDQTIAACYGDLIYFATKLPNKVVRYWRSSAFVKGAFAWGWCPPHPTFFVRSSVYQQYGLFNTDYLMGNDVELMMRFLEKYQIYSVYVPQILVKMRLGGVSNGKIKNVLQQNLSILQAARQLGIVISPLTFLLGKIINRTMQLIKKPRRELQYDK